MVHKNLISTHRVGWGNLSSYAVGVWIFYWYLNNICIILYYMCFMVFEYLLCVCVWTMKSAISLLIVICQSFVLIRVLNISLWFVKLMGLWEHMGILWQIGGWLHPEMPSNKTTINAFQSKMNAANKWAHMVLSHLLLAFAVCSSCLSWGRCLAINVHTLEN